MTSFQDLRLNDPITRALAEEKYLTPTPIQVQTIPIVMSGRDVIGEFVGSESGLGYLILVSTSQSRTPLAFGSLVLLTLMSIVLYYGVALIERIAVPWAPRN